MSRLNEVIFIDVPLNGSLAAVKKLEELLGMDLTGPVNESQSKL